MTVSEKALLVQILLCGINETHQRGVSSGSSCEQRLAKQKPAHLPETALAALATILEHY